MTRILISILFACTIFMLNIPAQAKAINEFEKAEIMLDEWFI